MSLTSNHTNPLLFSYTTHFRIREFRIYKRRKLKSYPKLTLHSHLANPSTFENLFHNLISQFPSPNSLHLLAPALGFSSGVALYLSQFHNNSNPEPSDIGEWILFTSPTPFNRFVLLRCTSISFEGRELLESVKEKLVKEDRHFLRLDSGRIHVRSGGNGGNSEKLEYQRVCVGTDDGGVVSLDWPANLDLEEEHGLDTTLLLVPGTAEGSMDRNVRSFVCEALNRGCFPVVMNPRGCAGSPLTTPRLFTAADSDDICTAIQFINKARPWTTLMGVGWGYGANMLTKYLAEVGEKTPLTAATCIDNPFDLEEATRSSPYHIAVDQKLTGGLIDILRSNKQLFQGRTKGFDVEKALLAKSVRDFEKAISMVSYGFETIEHFYTKSSTRCMVGNVKIPVLFIQNDDGTVPLFSIPRSLIAENPFTSLLLCSFLPSSAIANCRSAISWCQHLTIEWLTAVELGLLKGRHPLLKDVDLAINPSKGLALVESIASDNSGKGNKVLDLTRSSALNGYSVEPTEEILQESDTAASIHLRSVRDSQRNPKLEDKQDLDNGGLRQNNSVDAELVGEEEAGSVDSERGQVLQTAQVVMNILDVTMPGTLTGEKKKKVLSAVNQGETLMKALQDAVPEDVREKLTSAVSGILHTEGSNLNFDELLGIGRISYESSGLKSKIQEKVGISSAEWLNTDQMKGADDLADGSDNNQLGMDKPAEGLESELCPLEKSQKTADLGQSQSTSHGGNISSSGRKETNESGNNHENDEFSQEKAAPYPDYSEKGSEKDAKPNSPSWTEKAAVTEEAKFDEYKVKQVGGIAQLDSKEENNIQQNEEKTLDYSTDQNNMSSTSMTEEAVSPQGSSPEAQPMERDGNDSQERENKSLQPVQDQNKSTMSDSNAPPFSVSQAFDALTGMDDSTQMAVNSVFGVIENMISQLEEGRDDDNEVKDRQEDKDEKIDSESEKQHIIDGHMLKNRGDNENDPSVRSDALSKPGDNENDPSVRSDALSKPPVRNWPKNSRNSRLDARPGCVEEEPAQNSILFNGDGIDGSHENSTANYVGKGKNGKKDQLVGRKILAANIDRHVNKIPLYIIANPYAGSLQNEYLRKYLVSKIPDSDSLDMDTTTALLLDYFPEEGQWKLLEQPGNLRDFIGDVTNHKGVDRKVQPYSTVKANNTDKIIEPLYVILDSDKQQESVEKYETMDNMNEKVEIGDDRSEELMLFVKNIVLDSLKVEVSRRLSAADMKVMESDLARDLEQVANAVSLVIGHKEHIQCLERKDLNVDCPSEKAGTLQGEHIIRAISSAVHDTSYLRRVLPVGVIVGSSLAALRNFFDVATEHDNSGSEAMTLDKAKKSGGKNPGTVSAMEIDQMPIHKSDQDTSLDSSIIREGEKTGLKSLNNDNVMIGAVTAALGATALLVQRQDPYECNETAESSSQSLKERGSHQEAEELEESMSDKNQSNVVTSLAEKAMSVASPVVPTKKDGEVDQERLVAMLADLGQKGGILKLVGKIALLWGGLRGAMSLTDRLILFLRIAERPLFQRILGFVSMVLVLWSPVVVPLLPTLVQSWATNNPSKFAELVCIIGLYAAIMILVMIWGKRIREYENPLEQYGLDLTSLPKILNFLKGLIGGVLLVLSIHSANALLGCASLSWPSSLPSSSFDAVAWLKVYGQMLMLAGRGILTSTGVALVEELLFRSWLPEEIAADLGYRQGIIISGFAFSLLQRSPLAIPGLWLLSLGLAGARQRSQGSLSIPIGLRAGILASSFILQEGGFITYKNNVPIWITGTHPFQPFSGVVGLAFSVLLAVILYPRQPLQRKKLTRTIPE